MKITSIPEEMRNAVRWVLWRYEARDGKLTKVPYAANGRRAKSNDPFTWSSLGMCRKAYREGGYDGIGFMLGNGYAGLDIDNCLHDGQLDARAEALVAMVNSYTEVSPSGKGVKVFFKADVPEGKRTQDFELYGAGRYFTVTGQHLADTPSEVYEFDVTPLLPVEEERRHK